MLIMWGAACSWLDGLDSREVTQRWVASVTQEVWENTALMKTVSWEATPLVRGGKDINSFWNEVCQTDYVIWHPWEADHSYTTGSMQVPDDYCMVSSATFPQVHTQVECHIIQISSWMTELVQYFRRCVAVEIMIEKKAIFFASVSIYVHLLTFQISN